VRLLFINPNTSSDITALVTSAALGFASPGTEITGATGRFGARYILTRAAAAVAAHAALDAYAEFGAGADVVVLACFGDPGLAALKEIAHQPVVGMAEAACALAATQGERFAIVTGGVLWGPMLEEFVATLGMRHRLAAVRTIAPSGADIARDPDGALDLLAAACNASATQDGADCVILGGAGLADIAAKIAGRVRIPVIDSIGTAVRAAEALGAQRPVKAHARQLAAIPPVATIGLEEKLAALMEGR
jgi:allantoin racemase